MTLEAMNYAPTCKWQLRDVSTQEIEHQTKDSILVRSFLGLSMEEYLSKRCLQGNVKAIRAETWDLVNESIGLNESNATLLSNKNIFLASSINTHQHSAIV